MNKPISASKEVSQKKITKSLATYRRAADEPVPHLGLDEVQAVIRAVDVISKRKFKERNRLLIQTLFDGCLRISECLSLHPADLIQTPYGWQVAIHQGKGKKSSTVAISPSLAAQLQAYCYRHRIALNERIFPISASWAFQIIQSCMRKAGIPKPGHVGHVHILRHSGAIERLKATGNPRAVQDQLRHKSQLMTLRYLKTLSREESLAIQGKVDFQWL